MGNRIPASIALAMGFGMLVMRRPSAGHKPHSTMSTPHTTNAPTAAAKLASLSPAAISKAAPGVDHAIEMGMRYSSAKTMDVIPTVTHRVSSPDDA